MGFFRKKSPGDVVYNAACAGNVAAVRAAVQEASEAEVAQLRSYRSRRSKNSVLHGAAKSGSSELVELLLHKGFDARAINSSHETACDVASKQGHTAVVQLLQRHVQLVLDTVAADFDVHTQQRVGSTFVDTSNQTAALGDTATLASPRFFGVTFQQACSHGTVDATRADDLAYLLNDHDRTSDRISDQSDHPDDHQLARGGTLRFVAVLCAWLRRHAIDTPALFRLSGDKTQIRRLRFALDFARSTDYVDLLRRASGDVGAKVDVHAVAAVLKVFFREMRDALVPAAVLDEMLATWDRSRAHGDGAAAFGSTVRQLRAKLQHWPPAESARARSPGRPLGRLRWHVLAHVVDFLGHVAARAQQNQMPAATLALVWAPNLLRRVRADAAREARDLRQTVALLGAMIETVGISISSGSDGCFRWSLWDGSSEGLPAHVPDPRRLGSTAATPATMHTATPMGGVYTGEIKFRTAPARGISLRPVSATSSPTSRVLASERSGGSLGRSTMRRRHFFANVETAVDERDPLDLTTPNFLRAARATAVTAEVDRTSIVGELARNRGRLSRWLPFRSTSPSTQKVPKGRLFGRPLRQACAPAAGGMRCGTVAFVADACDFLLQNCATVEGLFRVPGQHAKVSELRRRLDFEDTARLNLWSMDPHDVASLVKLFLRELPEPLLTFDLYQPLLNAFESGDGEVLRVLARQLPDPNRSVFIHLFEFLARLSLQCRRNLMTPHNLGIVFAPSLMRRRVPDLVRDAMDSKTLPLLVAEVIEHFRAELAAETRRHASPSGDSGGDTLSKAALHAVRQRRRSSVAGARRSSLTPPPDTSLEEGALRRTVTPSPSSSTGTVGGTVSGTVGGTVRPRAPSSPSRRSPAPRRQSTRRFGTRRRAPASIRRRRPTQQRQEQVPSSVAPRFRAFAQRVVEGDDESAVRTAMLEQGCQEFEIEAVLQRRWAVLTVRQAEETESSVEEHVVRVVTHVATDDQGDHVATGTTDDQTDHQTDDQTDHQMPHVRPGPPPPPPVVPLKPPPPPALIRGPPPPPAHLLQQQYDSQ